LWVNRSALRTTQVDHLTRLFSDPAGALEGLSDDEIGAGLWSVLGGAGTALALNDETLPLAARIDCVRRIPTVYRELFVPRCAERLGHLSEQGGRLEMICYMFWDVASFGGPPGRREGNLFEDAVLDVLEDAVYLPHAACQERHPRPRPPDRPPSRAGSRHPRPLAPHRPGPRPPPAALRRSRPNRLHPVARPDLTNAGRNG
jgi:hypothetical protein